VPKVQLRDPAVVRAARTDPGGPGREAGARFAEAAGRSADCAQAPEPLSLDDDELPRRRRRRDDRDDDREPDDSAKPSILPWIMIDGGILLMVICLGGYAIYSLVS